MYHIFRKKATGGGAAAWQRVAAPNFALILFQKRTFHSANDKLPRNIAQNYLISGIKPSRLRADDLSETEVFLRERYEIGIRYTKLYHFSNHTQPSKDGGEESKIGKGKEEEGEEKESAERKNVGRRREGNADFCASFVVPSLLFPKFVLFAIPEQLTIANI